MPSLEEFQEMLDQDWDAALRTYVVHISEDLDGTISGTTIKRHAPERRDVEVVFESIRDTYVILMRAKTGGDAGGKLVSYLPWSPSSLGGIARADLDGSGPRYFSTSQLSGCRFTVQYADALKKRATVLHLAGDFGSSDGSGAREALETGALGSAPPGGLRRRYSIGQSAVPGLKSKTSFTDWGYQKKIGGDAGRIYYDGNKASVFGFRTDDGAWHFWAQEMVEGGAADKGLGRKDIG